VSFIMSVHLAEVIQIFVCVCAQMPLMRTPLQILFLILVTDLPPSIALGMEPRQLGIMREWPRPKKQPIVLGWMWQGIAANALILSASILGVYLWALQHYLGELDGEEISEDISELGDTHAQKLEKARTVAFISLVCAENVRAYVARSFDKPFYFDLLSNSSMQKAIGVAQLALYAAIFIPGVRTCLGLRGQDVDAQGWCMALAGAGATLLGCEAYKLLSRAQIAHQQRQLQALQEAAEAARLAEFEARGAPHDGAQASV